MLNIKELSKALKQVAEEKGLDPDKVLGCDRVFDRGGVQKRIRRARRGCEVQDGSEDRRAELLADENRCG